MSNTKKMRLWIAFLLALIFWAYYYHTSVKAELQTLQSQTLEGKLAEVKKQARALEKENEEIKKSEEVIATKKLENNNKLDMLYSQSKKLQSLQDTWSIPLK